jgi:UPF0271 protein
MNGDMKLNLNADMGESFGAWTMGDDAGLLRVVGAASIACGFHAGDPLVMERAVRAAHAAGVDIGAHPGFADLQGFGRREIRMSVEEVRALIVYQVGAMLGVARATGARVVHVKPHGALNNMACREDALADAIAAGVAAVDPALILLAPATSPLWRAGLRAGLPTAAEIFADRTYLPDGQLTPRSRPDALIHDPADGVAQILRFLRAGGIGPEGGAVLPTPIHSVCVHGDGPNAAAIAAAVRDGLAAAGVRLTGLAEALG